MRKPEKTFAETFQMISKVFTSDEQFYVVPETDINSDQLRLNVESVLQDFDVVNFFADP